MKKYLQYNPLYFIDILSKDDINTLIEALWYHEKSKSLIETKLIKYWSNDQRSLLMQKLLPLTFCGLTMSLLQEMRLLEPLNYVLPTPNEMTNEKHKLRNCLLTCFDPKITNHGISLDHSKVLTEAILTHGLENQTFLLSCITFDCCSVAHHKTHITTGGIKLIAPKLPCNQSKNNCYKTVVYYGKDNEYYLSRNLQRTKKWIEDINNSSYILINENKKINTEPILIADWVSLQNITNCKYCPLCNITNDDKWELDKIWDIIEPDLPPSNSILPIKRKNIFFCFLHGDIRITENLIKQLLLNHYLSPNLGKLELFKIWLENAHINFKLNKDKQFEVIKIIL